MLKVQSFIRKVIYTGLFAVLPGTGVVQAAEIQSGKSIYKRLGGIYPISVVVDTFNDMLLVNDVLNANPAIKAARDLYRHAV